MASTSPPMPQRCGPTTAITAAAATAASAAEPPRSSVATPAMDARWSAAHTVPPAGPGPVGTGPCLDLAAPLPELETQPAVGAVQRAHRVRLQLGVGDVGEVLLADAVAEGEGSSDGLCPQLELPHSELLGVVAVGRPAPCVSDEAAYRAQHGSRVTVG